MAVDSYLELFTTLFGWQFYTLVWGVLRDTGIVFLPFLGILIDNFTEPARGGDFGRTADLSMRRMELDVLLALFVVVIAGQPSSLTPLNASILSYTPPPTLNEPAPAVATVDHSQSTYGVTGFTGAPGTVDVPLWWYAVMAFSAGFNHAVVEGIPRPADLRTYAQQARLATIENGLLRQEVADFFSECFVVACSRYQQIRPTTPAIDSLLTTYGNDDPDWMGSQVYRNTPGYYDTIRPHRQIVGWPFDPSRDLEYDPASRPTWGHPTCQQWWESTGTPIGLRQKLIDEADATSGGLSGWVVAMAPGLASEKQRDIVAKTVLNNSPPVYTNNDFMLKNSSGDGFWASLFDLAKGGTAAGGIIGFSGLFAVTMAAVIPALPMIQAVILLGIYGLLPLLVVLSRYSLSLLVLGAMLIFTVKFWTVLWYFALWVDQNLIASMYPDISLFLEQFSLDNLATGEQSSKRLLLNMITTSLYLGLPLLWSGMMALAGLRVGRAIESATDRLTTPARGAGDTGATIARRTATRGRA